MCLPCVDIRSDMDLRMRELKADALDFAGDLTRDMMVCALRVWCPPKKVARLCDHSARILQNNAFCWL